MNDPFGLININHLATTILKYQINGLVDDTNNLKFHNVYVYSGTMDFVVRNSIENFICYLFKVLIITIADN